MHSILPLGRAGAEVKKLLVGLPASTLPQANPFDG